MKFDENLRNLRKEKDYSQEYLALKLGVTRQTISKWENATAMPDLKKLTEIADFFEVSMDTLLGMEFATSDDGNTDNQNSEQYQKQYAEQLLSVVSQNQNEQNHANQKTVKVLAVILAIAIICVIFVLVSLSNIFDDKMQNLQNQINMLSGEINRNQNYNDDYYNDNEFEYNFLSFDKEKNYMVNTELKYMPSTYPKNASVYFSIINKDGTTQKIDATEDNGVFVGTANIDVTAAENGYVYIDDGEVVTKENVFWGFTGIDFISLNTSPFSFRCSTGGSGASYENNMGGEVCIQYYLNYEITDAYLVAEKNGKEIYSEKLEFTHDPEDTTGHTYIVNTPDFLIKDSLGIRDVYLKLVDENGIIYKFYAEIDGIYEIDEDYVPTYAEKGILFADNKVLEMIY